MFSRATYLRMIASFLATFPVHDISCSGYSELFGVSYGCVNWFKVVLLTDTKSLLQMQYFPKTHQYNLVSIMHRFRQCISCFCIVWTKYFVTHIFNILVEGNLIFCFMGSWENYFGSVGRRSNNNNNNNDNNNNNNIIIIIRSVRVNTSKKILTSS